MSGARSSASRLLAIGISGIQQLGADFYVEPLFNGLTLIGSIGIAGYAQRKRAGSTARKVRSTVMRAVARVPAGAADIQPQPSSPVIAMPAGDILRTARDRAERIAGAIAPHHSSRG